MNNENELNETAKLGYNVNAMLAILSDVGTLLTNYAEEHKSVLTQAMDDEPNKVDELFDSLGNYNEEEGDYDEEDCYEDHDYYEGEYEEEKAWPNTSVASQQPSWPNVDTPKFTTHSWPNVSTATAVAQPKVDTSKVKSAADGVMRQVVKADSRGRICVPAAFIGALGLSEGDDLWAAYRAGGLGLMLLRYEPASGVITNYYVDRYLNVRLSEWCLNRAGLSGSVKLRMTNNKRGIVVVPA